MTKERRKLTAMELANAARAKALWLSKKKAEKLSQESAAGEMGAVQA
jgi:hypothetical protein